MSEDKLIRSRKVTLIKIMLCHDVIMCMTSSCSVLQIADYEPPYKQSSHPVCTYSGRQSRSYRLRHCHPAHPEPYAEVFDAVACVCKTCSADDTSCEDFNG